VSAGAIAGKNCGRESGARDHFAISPSSLRVISTASPDG
jgi:hypothetical protein